MLKPVKVTSKSESMDFKDENHIKIQYLVNCSIATFEVSEEEFRILKVGKFYNLLFKEIENAS